MLSSVTVALAIAAPLLSRTVPRTSAFSNCAKTGAVRSAKTEIARRTRNINTPSFHLITRGYPEAFQSDEFLRLAVASRTDAHGAELGPENFARYDEFHAPVLLPSGGRAVVRDGIRFPEALCRDAIGRQSLRHQE